ncbi:MAG: hypothetical protein WBW71_08070 [Bacteroidota bacterium]
MIAIGATSLHTRNRKRKKADTRPTMTSDGTMLLPNNAVVTAPFTRFRKQSATTNIE